MEIPNDTGTTPPRLHAEARLEAASWGAFFLWLGVALWADLGWGIGLLGVGVITLATQAFRKRLHLDLEGFWLLVGGLFTLGGLWELSGTTMSIVPVLLVIAGLALVYSAVMGQTRHRSAH